MPSYADITPNFKERYGTFINPLPEENTLADAGEFLPRDMRPGRKLNFPVKVTNEHGQTKNVDGTAFAINASRGSVMAEAQIDGAEMLLSADIPYNVSSRSSNGTSKSGSTGGAFWDSMDYAVESLMTSGGLYRELDLMYGAGTAAAVAANIGVVSASISGADLAAPQVVSITRATWSPGIWNQMTNALVDIYQSDGTTLRESGVTFTSHVAATNRITLTKAGSVATAAAGDVIVVAGARTKSCYGLQSILENTGSLFNISASTYNIWKAVSFSSGSAALTRAKIGQFASRLHPNGGDQGGDLFVGGPAFADLSEEADDDARWTDSNTSSVKKQGTNKLVYRSPIGEITVVLHKYMKQSLAPYVAKGNFKRVGSTDLTFDLKGHGKWFYLELPGNAGCQIRIYSHQAPILETPYHNGLITAISSNGDTTP